MKVPASLPLFSFTAVVLAGLLGALVPGWSADELLVTNQVRATEATNTVPETVTNRPVEFSIPPQFLEQIRREIEESSARNAAAITTSLNLLEPALSRLQQRQDEALLAANNKVLIMASVFAGTIFLVLVAMMLILARTLGRFSELAATGSPQRRALPSTATPAALEAGGPSGPDQAVEQASNRFQGALEQLQRRIRELEHGLQGSNGETAPHELGAGSVPRALHTNGISGTSNGAGDPAASFHPLPQPGNSSGPISHESSEAVSCAAVLLGKGQTLLNLGDWKGALACFEQVLTMTPNNAEAQVKKGLALEQLENWDGALESYNRALAIDGTLTVAYLYKGAVCNRLQRYDEALASYELALQGDRKSRAS